MVKKTRVTLSNGLPLIVVEIPDSKSLVTSYWTKAGARFDPDGKSGMAHFLEHLLIKKSKNYPTDIELAQELEKVGAFKNGTTSKEWMNLNISSAKDDYDLTIRILSEMVFNPYIEKDGFEKERKVIFQEKSRKESLPDDLVWEVWCKLFFSGSKMATSVLGDKTSLNNISVKDVQVFWKEHSLKKSNILFIAGGIKTDKIIKLAEKYFGKVRLSGKDTPPKFKYNHSKKILIEKRLLPRANMLMSFTIPRKNTDKDIYALAVLRNILLGGWSSRLYQRLRVKESLIYGSGARLMKYIDIASFNLLLATDKDNFPKLMSVLCEELIKIREEGITDEELTLAKGWIKGTMMAAFETSWDYVEWYQYGELYDPKKVETPEEKVAKIMKVKKEDVDRVAKKYLTKDNWLLAVVGDVKEKSVKVNL